MPNKSLKSGPCAGCGKPTPIRVGRPIKFCSTECLKVRFREMSIGNTYRVGHRPTYSYPAGHVPWNKGKKGMHLSRAALRKRVAELGRELAEKEAEVARLKGMLLEAADRIAKQSNALSRVAGKPV